MGEIVRIWIKRARGAPMDRVDEAELVAGRGIAGNADQGGRRQITVIEESAWREAQAALGVEVDPSFRRANVLLRGLDLRDSRGKTLQLGACQVRVFTETTPCIQMERAHAGLRDALRPHWRGGVSCEIVAGGTIRVGDAVSWTL